MFRKCGSRDEIANLVRFSTIWFFTELFSLNLAGYGHGDHGMDDAWFLLKLTWHTDGAVFDFIVNIKFRTW